MAGTGTPSLDETKELNHAALQLGFEAVVVLPPFFFRNASEDGLFDWFAELIETSIPDGKFLLGYHIPAVSGVSLPVSMVQKLSHTYPEKFGGIKDSTGSQESAEAYIAALPHCAVFVGNDKLLSSGLAAGAAGCITALANLRSPESRAIYDSFLRGEDGSGLQEKLNALRAAMDEMPPAPAYIKALLHTQHKLKPWSVHLPLRDLSPAQTERAWQQVQAIDSRA
jgi:4-hydroxy-tetrahydrodipicolinate synthase